MTSVVKMADYDVKEFEFIPFPENFKKNTLQNLLLPTYKGEKPPVISLPWVVLDAYGIPSKSDFFKTDTQRHFIKMPLNNCKELTTWLSEIDNKFSKATKRKELLGAKSKHVYQSLVKTPVPNEDETVKKSQYVKFKIASNYPSNNVVTSVTVSKNGEILEPVIETIDDVLKHVPFKSTVKLFISPSKLWSINNNDSSSYGITFKVVKILCKSPKIKVNNSISNIESYFDDLDCESE